MIGETTLAMLYVPLLFYLFDRLSERSKAKKESKPAERTPAEGSSRHKKGRPERGRATDMCSVVVITFVFSPAGCMGGPDWMQPANAALDRFEEGV